MYFYIKRIQFIYQKINLKTLWNCYWLKINAILYYVYIKDFNIFMFNKSKYKDKKLFCMNCLRCFSSKEIVTNHLEVCLEINGKQDTKMPEKTSKLQFTGHHKQLKAFLWYMQTLNLISNKFKKSIGIILVNHTLINIKIMLLVVMYTNQFVLMTNFVSLYKNIAEKIQFTNLLVKCLKKLIIVKKL